MFPMQWLTISQIVSAISLLLTIICLIIVTLQKPSSELHLAIVYTIFTVVSCLGYCGIAFSNGDVNTIILSTKLRLLGTLVLVLVFFLTSKYLKVELPLYFHIIVSVAVLFVLMTIIFFDAPENPSLSNPLSWGFFCRHWYFKEFEVKTVKGISYLDYEIGWGYFVYLTLSLSYAVLLTIIFARIIMKKKRTDVKNLILLYLIIMIPNVCYLIDLALRRLIGPAIPIQAVVLGRAAATIIFVYLIGIKRFCNVSDLASNTFFDSMNIPAFVIDSDERLVNMNKTARGFFPEVQDSMIGKQIYQVFNGPLEPVINEILSTMADESGLEPLLPENVENTISVANIIFQPKIYKIISDNKVQGYVVWMEDVTALKNESIEKMQALRDKMILGFSSLAENHDFSTQGHLHRTSSYAKAIAQELYEQGMFKDQITPMFISTIEQVAPLHDIGKTYISKEIFNKPGKLDENEIKIMRQHTTLGAEFLSETLKESSNSLFAQMAIDIALRHHEWWNGKGYPGGLSGNDIPLSARIMAVADTFDALVTVRPYKRTFTCEEAFEIIQNESGTHFEPGIVLCFLSISDKIKELKNKIEMQDRKLEEVEEDFYSPDSLE